MLAASLTGLVLRASLSLGLILVIVAIAYTVAKRRASGLGTSAGLSIRRFVGERRPRRSAPIEVVGRVGLTRNTSAVAIKFGDKVMLVSASEQAESSVLSEMSVDEWETHTAPDTDTGPDTTSTRRHPTRDERRPARPRAHPAPTTRHNFLESLRQATARHE